jgi:1-acyl-sn-glycerol-3-phosphate acyltransferase
VERSLFGTFVRSTLGRLVPLLFRTRLIGRENLPAGGAVLAGNHVSYMDPVLLWCVSPRPVHFMAKRELWESRVLGWLLDRFWAFPVTRGEPDRSAIARATEVLTHGGLVGVFPEGTRASADGQSAPTAHGGAAFLAIRAGVPLVPMAFVGTEKVWPRGQRLPKLRRVTIAIGEPLLPDAVPPDLGRKERVDALTAMLMERIAEQLRRAKECQ